jgi:hypothetical protein
MADNITAPASGAVLATDDIGGVHHPRTKISIGADGSAADVHAGNPLPAILRDSAGADALGLVTASPAATSLLGRLKAIADAIAAQSAYVDGLEASATALNGYVDGLEALFPAALGANGGLKVDIVGGAGSGGSGTEYTEDAASAANPAGGMLIARRRDTLSGTEVSADGDNIALNATAKGQLHVSDSDLLASFGAIADSAYAGSGSATAIALLKGIFAQVLSLNSYAITSGYYLAASAASKNQTNAKAAAGALFGAQGKVAGASDLLLWIYDKVTAPVHGTDTPIKVLPLPAGKTFSYEFPGGRTCAYGIGFAITTEAGAAVGANDVKFLNLDF